MTSLLLIRHGETVWNAERRLQGQTDIPLSSTGRSMVKGWSIPEEFDQFEWVSSPLQRATETAKILGHMPMIEPALREMSWGQWEGLNWKELQVSLGREAMLAHGADSLDFRPPGGESPRDLQTRLRPWLEQLKRPTIAICHKGVLQAIYALASGWEMSGKPKIKFKHGDAYLFQVGSETVIEEEMNISLTNHCARKA
jgi:broad specificity phosphatase PhoE